jgi:D-sedoheptulose 7-phosphate isomerase
MEEEGSPALDSRLRGNDGKTGGGPPTEARMTFDIIAYARQGAELRQSFFAENEAKLREAAALIRRALADGGKLLAFGNGGSAADAQHLAGEFVGRFKRERAALPAIALSTDTSVLTCVGNDYGYEKIFARQVEALGQKGDVAWAISTSGKSPNVLAAIAAAKRRGLSVIGLAGADGGRMAPNCNILFSVPSTDTPLVQEIHTAILHAICAMIDEE